MTKIYVVLVHGADDEPPLANYAFFTLNAAQAKARELAESRRDEAAARRPHRGLGLRRSWSSLTPKLLP